MEFHSFDIMVIRWFLKSKQLAASVYVFDIKWNIYHFNRTKPPYVEREKTTKNSLNWSDYHEHCRNIQQSLQIN